MTHIPLSPHELPRNPGFGRGRTRRRIELQALGTQLAGRLVDNFHDMRCTIEHDGRRIVSIGGSMPRHPTTQCPGAVGVLQELVGLPLATPFESIYTGGRARRNCTHLFDLAALAIAQAARGTPARCYEAIVPDPGDAPVTIEVRRDGQLVHSWSAQAGQIVAPAEFAGRTLRQGFAAWASGAFAGDEFEAALVLARTVFVSYGRRWNMAAWAGLTARRTSRDTDLCYAYSKQRADTTVFLGTNVRDDDGAEPSPDLAQPLTPAPRPR